MVWHRRRFLALLIALGVVPLGRSSPAAEKPNIVIIVADDLGNADLGYRGSAIKTPHIDALARGGARLESYYGLPVCTPARAALMTGRHPTGGEERYREDACGARYVVLDACAVRAGDGRDDRLRLRSDRPLARDDIVRLGADPEARLGPDEGAAARHRRARRPPASFAPQRRHLGGVSWCAALGPLFWGRYRAVEA